MLKLRTPNMRWGILHVTLCWIKSIVRLGFSCRCRLNLQSKFEFLMYAWILPITRWVSQISEVSQGASGCCPFPCNSFQNEDDDPQQE